MFLVNENIANLSTVVVPQDEDSHDNLWKKLTKSVQIIHEKFGGQFDFYYKIDDDTFALMGNLRHLSSDDVQKVVKTGNGVYIGRYMDTKPMQTYGGGKCLEHEPCCMFCVGGPGYLLDDKALSKLSANISSCHPGFKTSADDLMVGCCLQDMGILPLDTRDSDGGERFHPFDP